MTDPFPPADDPTDEILGFLRGIGLAVTETDLSDDCFLPGILFRRGELLLDRARLAHPGDLLHEAGHLAVLDPAARRRFGDPQAASSGDMRALEIAAIGWSFAAARHLELDLGVVFHAGGYAGRGPELVRSFAFGLRVGVCELEAAGMAATPRRAAQLGVSPYPHMIKWLHD